MKIAEVNMTHLGSTGNIMFQIAQRARKAGHQVKTFSSRSFSFQGPEVAPEIPEHTYFGSYLSRGIHTIGGILTGGNGFFSIGATLKLIRELKKFSPDIIHLHNLHQFCINFPLFFRYLKRNEAHVVWTLHDCWALTGHCAHFDYIGCKKWKTTCCDCPQYSNYPKSKIDNSKWMHKLKRSWFSSIKEMTIVTPSQWLANLVKQSFLGDYHVKVIQNGIDLSVFRPTKSEFRKKYQCEDKFLLLSVAFDWGARKGLDVMIRLAEMLNDNYRIVLVGTNELVEKGLPENIISIRRTNNQTELAEIYSAADLFVNPTREEVLGLVNLEALACGTPVVTFSSGGSPECVDDSCGCVVERDNLEELMSQITRICSSYAYDPMACIKRANMFNKNDKCEEYVKLYEGN